MTRYSRFVVPRDLGSTSGYRTIQNSPVTEYDDCQSVQMESQKKKEHRILSIIHTHTPCGYVQTEIVGSALILCSKPAT